MQDTAVYDMKLKRGDSYEWSFIFWQDKEKTDPYVLTGATVAAEFRDKPGGASIVRFQCTVIPPNTIDMVMTPAMWSGAAKGGEWDLEVTHSPTEVHTMLEGKVVVSPDVTNSSVTPVSRSL